MRSCQHDKFEPILEKDEYGITMVYALKCKECEEEFIIKPITEISFNEIAIENDLI